MKKIYKYPLALADRQTIEVARAYSILSIGHDAKGDICPWVGVGDDDAPVRQLEIILVGTGKPLPPVGHFLGTVHHGQLVLHAFTGTGCNAGFPKELGFYHYTKDNG